MNKYKKYMYIGIFILLISLVGSVGTYAWFTWISPSNTKLTLSIGPLADVTFTSGNDINITNLAPVYNYTDGVSTTFTIKNYDSTSSLLYKVKLDITTIDNELKDESFKYTLLKDNSVVKEGNLSLTNNGTTLILNTASLDKAYSSTYSRTSTYKLYFWIDGNMENNPNMMNKSLIGKIDVGIETNVLTNTESNISSTSKFLNTSIARENISTLSFVDNIDVPEGLTTEDVSANKDGSILMWYTDTDGDGNYDVTIGSNNKIYLPTGYHYFSDLTNVTSINFSNIDTSGVTDMRSMFASCSNIEVLDLSNFDTSNVVSMGGFGYSSWGMFLDCKKLQNINLGSFNTSKVTQMGNMFYNCSSLTSLDLSNFDTSKVTQMGYMFEGCRSLTSLDLSNFDTSNVSYMREMFGGCSNLTSLDLTNFDTNNVTNMGWMFSNCSSLTNLDLSNFDTSKATDMSYMFRYCSSLINLDISNFDTSKVTDMIEMFSNCSSLTSLDLSNFDTSNAAAMSMRSMFSNCSSLTSLDVSSFDTSKVTMMDNMFSGCSSLTSLDLSNFDTSKVTTMYSMFYKCSSLTDLNLSSFTFTKNVSVYCMFSHCSKLEKLDLRNADFANSSSGRPDDGDGLLRNVPTSATIYLKNTEGNKTFMSTYYRRFTPTYV